MEQVKEKKPIILIGMPACGKSTVGVLLAKRLGYRFVDSDLVIQETEGRLLHELIASEGTDGFVLTNHYAPRHVDLPFEEWLVKYKNEYETTQKLAQEEGLSTLFGMEVTIERRDFLIYGLKPDALFESEGPLYDYTLEALYDFVSDRGGLLIHAHPFRCNGSPVDPRLVDGYEINCHPLYGYSFAKEVHELCDGKMLMTCGSDYHGDTYKPKCGVYLPDDLHTEQDLAAYLKSGQPPLLEHVIVKG